MRRLVRACSGHGRPNGRPVAQRAIATALLCTALPLPLLPMACPGVFAAETSATAGAAERGALRAFLARTLSDTSSFADRFAAEVWLLDMSTRLRPLVPDAERRLELLNQIHAAASRSELPPELVLAVIEVESRFDRFAVSRAGAQGLMQVMPFWKQELGREDDNLTDNRTNLEYGCRILQFYLQREKGNLHRALAAYNGSSGSRRYSNRVQRAWQARWRTAPLPW